MVIRLLTRRCVLRPASLNTFLRRRAYHSDDGVYGFRPDLNNDEKLAPLDEVWKHRSEQANVWRLISAYRYGGHSAAHLNLLEAERHVSERISDVPELHPARYNLSGDERVYNTGSFIYNHTATDSMSVEELTNHLNRIYCGTIGVEFAQLPSNEAEWFAEEFESKMASPICDEQKVSMGKLMLKSQAFDQFLSSKFTTVKRYSGEGAESMLCFVNELLSNSASQGLTDVVMCIAHRGRLNLLTCLLDFRPVIMFQKMRGMPEFPADTAGAGDVLSHLWQCVDLSFGQAGLHVSLIPNASHLEAANPVAVGKTRAKQLFGQQGDYAVSDENRPFSSMCVQIHGDAAVAAQGVVMETLALSSVPHYRTGGSVHLITNNQIGYTTEAGRGRSSEYASCVAKMVGSPIIHVNADDPEAVLRAASLSCAYRNRYSKDVFVDLICYRRWGHNEMDDPAFTQPLMYDVIRNRPSIPDGYAASLIESGLCSAQTLEDHVSNWRDYLSAELKHVGDYRPVADHLTRQWAGLGRAQSNLTRWDTGVCLDTLKFVGSQSVAYPEDFDIHPVIQKTHIERRIQRLAEGTGIDWATAEALAFGSLLFQGTPVRISGQDVGRGTFSQRHMMLVDQRTDRMHIPLNRICDGQTAFAEVANSILSEEAVLSFEYGFAIENPNCLVVWEAQFGDFFNGAQIPIDTLISAGESKWLRQCGVVLILPHGMDGAGPEHSSCRIERFLQLTDSSETHTDGDDVNMEVVNPTTPAQYFHLLRRQIARNFRKPLIIAGPKLLLRHSQAISTLGDMSPGSQFQPVLADDQPSADVAKVVFCSGKHYYALQKERDNQKRDDVAIIRLEALCPFPAIQLDAIIRNYPDAKSFIWSQEEHRNMGAWNFVSTRFANILGLQCTSSPDTLTQEIEYVYIIYYGTHLERSDPMLAAGRVLEREFDYSCNTLAAMCLDNQRRELV